MVLELFVRGVGRTGFPAPNIQDFCLAPKRVFSVAFEVSTSLSDKAGWPLSGGRRMIYVGAREDICVKFMRCKTRLEEVSIDWDLGEAAGLYHRHTLSCRA